MTQKPIYVIFNLISKITYLFTSQQSHVIMFHSKDDCLISSRFLLSPSVSDLRRLSNGVSRLKFLPQGCTLARYSAIFSRYVLSTPRPAILRCGHIKETRIIDLPFCSDVHEHVTGWSTKLQYYFLGGTE